MTDFLLLFACRTKPFATVGQQRVASVVELSNTCSLQATFGSTASQMREHLKEEEDIGLALLRQHFSEKEVAPVSPNTWHLFHYSHASRSTGSCYRIVLVWGNT